jgi:hypothetical protein
MSQVTDTNKSGDNNADTTQDQQKPQYTEEQQKHIDSIVEERLARQKKTLATEFQTNLTTELDKLRKELTPAPKGKKEGENDAEANQARQLIENEKAEARQAREAAQRLQTELDTAKKQNAEILKKQSITTAMRECNFYNPEEVMLLTESRIELDPETGKYIVRENGVVKKNSSLEPMTLEEFFKGYAQARPYLVNGSVVPGAGSSENSRQGSHRTTVASKADLKSAKEKSEYIEKFGLDAFEKLPAK